VLAGPPRAVGLRPVTAELRDRVAQTESDPDDQAEDQEGAESPVGRLEIEREDDRATLLLTLLDRELGPGLRGEFERVRCGGGGTDDEHHGSERGDDDGEQTAGSHGRERIRRCLSGPSSRHVAA
jgi:hypothetical protein